MQVVDAFLSLDVRSWRMDEAELPRETWQDVEARLTANGKSVVDLQKASQEWEDDTRKRARELERMKRRSRKRSLAKRLKPDRSKWDDHNVQEAHMVPAALMRTVSFEEWQPIRVGRSLPTPRFGHAMCMCASKAYLYGGRNRADVLEDLYCFDGAPVLWRFMPFDGEGPGSRVSHSMILLEHYIYVLGGGSANRSFNDLHRLDLYTMHWELLHTHGVGLEDKPDALIGHSIQWVPPLLVVFAGGNGRKPSNQLHTINLSSLLWQQIDAAGAPPAPRVGHASSRIEHLMCAASSRVNSQILLS